MEAKADISRGPRGSDGVEKRPRNRSLLGHAVANASGDKKCNVQYMTKLLVDGKMRRQSRTVEPAAIAPTLNKHSIPRRNSPKLPDKKIRETPEKQRFA